MGIVRRTKSVKAIIGMFDHSNGALSGATLVDRFKDQMNKTTVYRILERLDDEGLLHSFIGSDGLRWYAKCQDCSPVSHSDTHPHFQCKKCGKIQCLHMDIPFLPLRSIGLNQRNCY